MAASAVAARVDEVLVAAEVELGVRHPIEVAEEAAVTDLVAGGRLVLVTRPAAGAEERYAEELDVVRHALAPRPFRFEGATLPRARQPAAERPPAGAARPRHAGAGAGAARGLGRRCRSPRRVALERALGHLADADDDPAALGAAWRAAETPASIGAPRAARAPWDGAAALVARLRAGREAFGQDWACVAAPAEAAGEIGSIVRPRVQIDRLTPGLEEFWDAERPWEA